MNWLQIPVFLWVLLIGCATPPTKQNDRGPSSVSGHALFGHSNNPRQSVVRFKMKAQFEKIYKAAFGGNWTGEERESPEFWSDLRVTDSEGREFSGRVRARGMSSLQEGEAKFPKLRVELGDNENLEGTLFDGSRNFRINTHLEDSPSSPLTEMGRLKGDLAPYREGLAYDLAEGLGLLTPRTQRAVIEYENLDTKKVTTHNALIIETNKKIKRRIEGEESEEFPRSGEEDRIPIRIGALFHLYHVFIGNSDVGLRLHKEPSTGTEIYRPKFNTEVFRLKNQEEIPLVYDLDLAAIISSDLRLGPKMDISGLTKLKGLSQTSIDILYRLAFLRARLSKAEYEQAFSDFWAAESRLENIIETAECDPEGKLIALDRLQGLREAEKLLRLYPMLNARGVRFYAEKSLKTDLVSENKIELTPGTLRFGTHVEVLERHTHVSKVAVLDSRGDLKDSEHNVGWVRNRDLVLTDDLGSNHEGPFDARDMFW